MNSETTHELPTPAPYPETSVGELEAIKTVVWLLDSNLVKDDLKAMDKVPNHDGTLELVDQDGSPIGTLKAQIKKIGKDEKQYSCPVELVAYSSRVSAPFVIICVDVYNQRAYWRHLREGMPEFGPEQKTFTIYFDPLTDSIESSLTYYLRWNEICLDYLRRVSEHPKLTQILESEIRLDRLLSDDRIKFQEFVDEINIMLDVDFSVVKNRYFADVWKIGVRIHEINSATALYSMYTIPNGENAPLLAHVALSEDQRRAMLSFSGKSDSPKTGGFHIDTGNGRQVSIHLLAKRLLDDPRKIGRDFVFKRLKDIIHERDFHVFGRAQSTELIMHFVRDYGHTLGLQPGDLYKVDALAYGFNVFLPMWYRLAFPKVIKFLSREYREALRANPLPSFEQIANLGISNTHPALTEVK